MKKGFLLFSILLITSVLYNTVVASNQTAYVPRVQEELTSEAYLHALRSNQHTGMVDEADLVSAYQQAKSQTSFKNQAGLNWTSLGPDNYGGKTKGVIYDNRDASNQTLLAGASGGGIWKSTNEGITWTALESPNLMVSSMVQDANGDIFIGTGDGFGAHLFNVLNDMGYTTGFVGTGLWKLSGENTFTQLVAPSANNNTSEWAFINELALSSGHIFAATNGGLKYSTDGGATWANAKDIDGNELTANATDIQSGTDGTLAASVGNMAYVSKTGNPEAFELRSTGEEGGLPVDGVARLEMAIAPSNSDIMYAATVTSFGVHGGIYRSIDKGDSWHVILPATTSQNLYNQRGLYNNYIAVFPNDPDRIIIGGQNVWEGKKVVEGGLFAWDVMSSAFGAGFSPLYVHYGQHCITFKPGDDNTFFLGTDGGIHKGTVQGIIYTYTTNNRNYITSQFYNIAPSGGENRVLAGAQGQGTIFVSGEGNTTRQGETLYAQNSSGGPCVVSTIHPEAIVVTSVAGNMQRSEDMAFTFSTQFLLSAGFGNTQAFQTPVALWESYEDYNSRDSVTFKARRAYQAGEVIKAKSNNFDHPFYYQLPAGTSLAVGDTLRVQDIVASKLFIAVANKIWMTKEMLQFGKTPDWFEISNVSVGLSGIPQSIAYSKDGNHLFVGMRDGKLFRISNIAQAYNYELADVNSPQCIVATKELSLLLPGTTTPVTQAVTSVAVDPNNPNNVLVTLANYGNDHYVFMTNNALDAEPTFVSKQGNGLPKMPVYASLIEMSNPGLAFIGTEMGVYSTANLMESNPTWTFDQGMGTVPVFDLKQQLINKAADSVQLINVDTLVVNYPGTNNYGIIYAATFGRGLYRANDYRKPVGVEERPFAGVNNVSQVIVYPNPVMDEALVKFELVHAGNVQVQVFDLAGKLISDNNLGAYLAGQHQIALNLGELKTGTYILRMISGNQTAVSKFLVY